MNAVAKFLVNEAHTKMITNVLAALVLHRIRGTDRTKDMVREQWESLGKFEEMYAVPKVEGLDMSKLEDRVVEVLGEGARRVVAP